MSERTKIEYADATFSPWKGCREVSPGCGRCFAKRLAGRFGWPWGAEGRAPQSEAYWRQPIKWNRRPYVSSTGKPWHRRRILVDLCDPWDPEAPDAWRHRFWELIRDTSHLNWLLLTKRPELIPTCWPCHWYTEPPSNVWLGVSVEDQQRADERIPYLLGIPAVIRWLSIEPLLGPVRIFDASCPHPIQTPHGKVMPPGAISWVVCGGESGPGARPCNAQWIRDVIRQCREAGVPCFVKQIGSNAWSGNRALNGQDCVPAVRDEFRDIYHPKGGDPAEWGEDLRVREFPQ